MIPSSSVRWRKPLNSSRETLCLLQVYTHSELEKGTAFDDRADGRIDDNLMANLMADLIVELSIKTNSIVDGRFSAELMAILNEKLIAKLNEELITKLMAALMAKSMAEF